MDTTKLQSALIDAGCTSIPFNVGGVNHSQAIADLPDATILRVLAYGKRMMNDYVNSAKATSDTPVDELSAGWITRAKEGTLGASGTTRASMSPMQKAITGIVVDYLRASGTKANEARKEAKDPQKAFEGLLRDKLAMAQGIHEAAVTDDQITEAMNKNWPKVEAQAAKVVEASRGLDIDIDID